MPAGEKHTRASLVRLITTPLVGICLFKVNNGNIRAMCKISSG